MEEVQGQKRQKLCSIKLLLFKKLCNAFGRFIHLKVSRLSKYKKADMKQYFTSYLPFS